MECPMEFTLCGADGKPGTQETDRAKLLGFITDFAQGSSYHAKMPLGVFMARLSAAYDLGQVKVYFSDYGECVGYVLWALLAPDVEEKLIRGDSPALHPVEWNEGTSLWIIDFLVRRGSLPYVLQDLRDHTFKDFDTITYFRVKGDFKVIKRIYRADFGTFFSGLTGMKK